MMRLAVFQKEKQGRRRGNRGIGSEERKNNNLSIK